MTTLTPISNANTLLPAPRLAPPATLEQPGVSGARPSSIVSLGKAVDSFDATTYSRLGLLPGYETVRESSAKDDVSRLLESNFRSLNTATRFGGLGAALVGAFAKNGTSISQSLLNATSARAATPGELKVDQELLHTNADNFVSLSVKTASGKTVTFSVSSQNGGLGVQANVDGGMLSDAELKEVGKLGEAFQGAIDGLTAQPPKLELGKLAQFDTRVLASVDLSGNVKLNAQGNVTLAFHGDDQSRTTRMSSPAGDVNVAVDLKNAAILGNARQQAEALKNYLGQFDKAQSRGKADPNLIAMFKSAFAALNSHYPPSTQAPDALTRSPADKGLLTGLADFDASISQAAQSPNPMRPAEGDTFNYKVAQTTQVDGKDLRNRTVKQDQQSSLSASYHQGLFGGKPQMGKTAAEQNYLYVQVNDKASSSASLGYKEGERVQASVEQAASQNMRTQKYVSGKRVGDTSVPEQALSKRNVLALLAFAARDSKQSREALANLQQSVLLQGNPFALPR
ncbi:MAG: hypothetical protein GAK37_03537 [Pseudomonas sp.]|nr:MAG: hypothetical protein GAK37_03537 [Pseudomonas sp.]